MLCHLVRPPGSKAIPKSGPLQWGLTIIQSGGSISQINDKSGKSNHVSNATTAAQPTVDTNTQNGLSLARIQGQYLQSGQLAGFSAGSFTIYSAASLRSPTNGAIVDITNALGATNRTATQFFENGNSFKTRFSGTGDGVFTSTATAFSVLGSVASRNLRRFYYNGTAGSDSTSTLTALAANYLRFGSLASNVYYWTGSIGEIVVADGVLAEADRLKLEGYLAWKWGTQGNLPANHPYKAAAPTVDDGAGVARRRRSMMLIAS